MKEDVRCKIIAKAWKDEKFRKKLLNNPHAALKEFGIKIPKNVKFDVFQEDANHLYFTLPPPPAKCPKMEERELENLAAGHFTAMTWCIGQECYTRENC